MTNKLTKTTNTSLDGCRIRVQRINNQEYLCLTDLAGYTKKPHEVKIIQQWLRLKKTYQFLTEWETLNNPGFKPIEFEPKSLSVTKWVQLTGAIGLVVSRGGVSVVVLGLILILLQTSCHLFPLNLDCIPSKN